MHKETVVVNCRTDDYDTYIGRGSKWGNPFVMRNKSKHERDRVCDAYEAWFKTQPELVNSLSELIGKRLGCYCKPERCHGDFLAREVNKIKIEENDDGEK